MNKATARTLQALKGSIKKWENITYNKGKDNGGKNCPLCQIFRKKINCPNCPIKLKTKQDYCFHTPYTIWSIYFNIRSIYHDRIVFNEITKKLAKDELNFLKEIKK